MLRHHDDFDPEYDVEITRNYPLPPPLPCLLATPKVYSGCCLGLSAPFLDHLRAALPAQPSLSLSIGSGYGLLEALLLSPPYDLNIVGVEVQPSPNIYLPAESHRIVPGTRFLESLAAKAEAWLFVYPRRVGLVEEYMLEYTEKQTGSVRTVVWIGPTADWDDYRKCFESGWHVNVTSAGEVGGRAWETVAIARAIIIED